MALSPKQNTLTPVDFDYSKAASGALVGLTAEDGTIIDSGAFVQSDTLGTRSVTINGQTLSFDADGKCTTAGDYYGMTLKIMETELSPTQDNVDTGESSPISIAALNPRDHFAIIALQGILQHLRGPHEMSDANMLYYSKVAYKWAQAMLVASIDARKDAGESTDAVDFFVSNHDNMLEVLRDDIGNIAQAKASDAIIQHIDNFHSTL